MLYVLSAMAYGDCLITLSLLEQLPESARPYRLLGTRVTSHVSAMLRRPLPVTELLPDKAAFYTIKERGARAAVADFFSLRRSLREIARPGDVIAFERPIMRNRLLKPPGIEAIYAPFAQSAHADRQKLVRQLFDIAPEWRSAVRPATAVRNILVNPCARYAHRWLSPAILSNLVEICSRRGWRMTLVDPCGQSGRFAAKVADYRTGTELPEAIKLLRESDLYIGPDSFFIHLAYYFSVPFFGFFHPNWLYFLPPGCRGLQNYCSFEIAGNTLALEQALDRFLLLGVRSTG